MTVFVPSELLHLDAYRHSSYVLGKDDTLKRHNQRPTLTNPAHLQLTLSHVRWLGTLLDCNYSLLL